MSKTPESDQESKLAVGFDMAFHPHEPIPVVPAEFARRLERERDEARRSAESWRDDQRRTYTAAGGEWHPEAHLLPWEYEENKEFSDAKRSE